MKTNTSTVIQSLLAGVGAMLTITVLAALSELDMAVIFLMAPFGATMVLLYAVPQSPLAQPRNIFFGHVLTTSIGLVVLQLLGTEPWTLGLAVGCAVAMMIMTDTVHPPAGANPLVVMLTGQSWSFLLMPVAAGAAIILLLGVLYHKWVSGHNYPARK